MNNYELGVNTKYKCILFSAYIYYAFNMYSSLDKQTTATQESDTGEVICSGNVSYGKVTMKSGEFKSEEDGNEDNYDYVYSKDT